MEIPVISVEKAVWREREVFVVLPAYKMIRGVVSSERRPRGRNEYVAFQYGPVAIKVVTQIYSRA
jgi:hypothetical protein